MMAGDIAAHFRAFTNLLQNGLGLDSVPDVHSIKILVGTNYPRCLTGVSCEFELLNLMKTPAEGHCKPQNRNDLYNVSRWIPFVAVSSKRVLATSQLRDRSSL
jgi:hypothetical protein